MTISIVIPSYNEESIIGRCLESIVNSINYFKSIYPINCNIVVVDDSTDSTGNIANTFDYVTVISGDKNGISSARSMGTLFTIINFDSEIIVSTDADIVVPYDWLFKIYSHFYNDKNLAALSGIYKEMKDGFFEKISTNLSNKWFIGLGGNTAFRREYYLLTEGYNVCISNSEDIDLWDKLNKVGKVLHDENIYVYHDSGYRWRASIIYPTSAFSIISGCIFKPLRFLIPIGITFGGYEVIKNGNKLKNIAYNKSKKECTNVNSLIKENVEMDLKTDFQMPARYINLE